MTHTLHRGTQRIELDMVPGENEHENRVVAYMRYNQGTPVGEQDQFLLNEGELLYLNPKDRGSYQGRLYKKPLARLRKLWVWQETGEHDPGAGKKLSDAKQFNLPEFPKIEKLFPDSDGNPDVQLVLSEQEVRLEHLAGANQHARYLFSIQLGLIEPGQKEERLAVFDPDVHDEAPHR